MHWWDKEKEQCPSKFYFNNFCNKNELKIGSKGVFLRKRAGRNTKVKCLYFLVVLIGGNFKMKSDITLPLFDTDIWCQKQIRLIRNLSLPSFLFVCYFYFYFYFYYFCCSVSNEEARHEVESEASERTRYLTISHFLLAQFRMNEKLLLRLEVFNLHYVSEKCTVYQTLAYSDNIINTLLLFLNMLQNILRIMLSSIRP